MVVNPLHYKRLVTKRKLHVAYNSIFISVTIVFIIGFIFFRQEEFIVINECFVVYILQQGFYLFGLLLCIVLIIIMLISYIIVTVKLKQRSRQFGAEISNNANDINSKIMKASWLALSAFLILYTPFILLTLFEFSDFLEKPYPIYYIVIDDICSWMYFLNSLINPFLYYKILSDFREGYKRLLTCSSVRNYRK